MATPTPIAVAAAASALPSKMRAMTISTYGPASTFTLNTLFTPSVTSLPPTSVLLRIHACALNPADLRLAAGDFKIMQPFVFPYTLCNDLVGTIVALGSAISTSSTSTPTRDFKIGDKVISQLNFMSPGGAAAEYAVTDVSRIAKAPSPSPSPSPTAGTITTCSDVDSAALPCAGLTALQALDRAEKMVEGGVSGKTVLVTGALGGVGSYVVQMAKHVYGAATVIGTCSAGKITQLQEMGCVDRIVDYGGKGKGKGKRGGVLEEVEKGSVDIYIDTAPGGTAFSNMAVMKKGGVVVSCTSLCNGKTMKGLMGEDGVPKVIGLLLDLVFAVNRWRAGWWWGVGWDVQLTVIKEGDFDRLVKMVEEGKVRTIVGKTVKLGDIEEIRAMAELLASGKGAVGKYVIEIE